MCAHTPNILVQLSYNTLYHVSAPILDPIPRALLRRLITAPVAGCSAMAVVGRPPHSMPSNARMDFGGTGRISTENSCSAPYLVVFSCRQQLYPRSCHAALPTPPWRRPRLENAQCPARRDRCLPHHHPRRAARAEPPRCATRRAARALPPRQPPPLPSGTTPPRARRRSMQFRKNSPVRFLCNLQIVTAG